jgi:hypothetical protein
MMRMRFDNALLRASCRDSKDVVIKEKAPPSGAS